MSALPTVSKCGHANGIAPNKDVNAKLSSAFYILKILAYVCVYITEGPLLEYDQIERGQWVNGRGWKLHYSLRCSRKIETKDDLTEIRPLWLGITGES